MPRYELVRLHENYIFLSLKNDVKRIKDKLQAENKNNIMCAVYLENYLTYTMEDRRPTSFQGFRRFLSIMMGKVSQPIAQFLEIRAHAEAVCITGTKE